MIDRSHVEALLATCGVTVPAIVGIRGPDGNNLTGVFDDRLCIITVTDFKVFTGNTDPSKMHPNVAVLRPGVWHYKQGIHGLSRPVDLQYHAFVQAAPVTVDRANGKQDDSGYFGINIHRGGRYTTSSEGCQTVHATEWPEFKAMGYAAMDAAGVDTIPYVLVEGPLNADSAPGI